VPRSEDESRAADLVAHAWLERYGVVARDIHRRERPNVPWRAIYEQLRDGELRGAVRRGYFVEGLSGAQFALPDAVERLREVAGENEPPAVCMSARDPANAYRWARGSRAALSESPAPAARAHSLLVTRAGRPVLVVEIRSERIRRAPNASADDVTAAALALTRHLRRRSIDQATRQREYRLRTIDEESAVRSDAAAAFTAAGWRKVGLDLIFDPRRDTHAESAT